MDKKKLLLPLLILALVLSACDNSTESQTTEATTEATEALEETTDVTEAEESEEATEEAENTEQEEAETSDEASAERFEGEYIISVDEFESKIGDPNTIIIDARGSDDPHVEGAIPMSWGQLADTADKKQGEPGWGHIYEPETANPILSELGIDPEKDIILYSNAEKGWGEDGRILWQLDAYGFENLWMVDGGIDAIEEAGIELTKDEAEVEPVEVNVEEIDYSTIIDTDQLRETYDDHVIVDVRNKEEYDGAVLYGEAKGGHLPGAINIQYIDLFDEDGKLKSNDEIDKMFVDAGLNKDHSIVNYCTGGIRSAYMQKIMEMLGYENAMNYQGSYYNWASSQEVE